MNHLFVPGDNQPDISEVGGKALNLDYLSRLELTVPAWFALKTSAFERVLKESGLNEKIGSWLSNREGPELAAALKSVREMIVEAEMPKGLREEIVSEYSRSFSSAKHVAVRSSAVDEDSGDQSFAGLHDSFLFIKGEESVIDAVRKVWASAYNERAVAYRRENGLSVDRISIAVIVQEMVEAETSGVMFTVNPVSGSVNEVVISSLYGAGEGLVSEGLDADTYTVDKESGGIEQELACKSEKLVLDAEAGAGLKRLPVEDSRKDVSSLTDNQIKQTVAAGLAAERSYSKPQDMEFSFDKSGKLFVLQARPVTTAKEYGPAAGNHLIWDNSNIIESYSGVTSPMTFSFIRRAYTIVYNCFCEVMGIHSGIIRENQTTFSNMLGLIQGQVYYNLLNWYRLVRLFPGFNYNKEFMESMMGVKEPAELKDEYKQPGFLRKYFVELPNLLRLLVRSTINFARIKRLSNSFQSNFDRHYSKWSAMDFSQKKPHELMAIYRDMEDRLLWNWKAPIINDFFVMIFYGALRKLCGKWCDDTGGSLQNDLICGEGGIESTEPTKMLLKLASIAQKQEKLRDMILNQSADDLAEAIPDNRDFSEFSNLMKRYLDLYGFRCMNELKLEEYSLRDKPQFVYTIIRNYLSLDKAEALDVAAMEAREQSIRSSAEKLASEKIAEKKMAFIRKPLFNWVLNNARLGVKNRENMRFARTKIYGLLRELIRALGTHFNEEGILSDREDVFYLSLDECFDLIKGTAITTDLQALADIRKKEFSGYRDLSERAADDRFDTYGIVYHMNLFQNYGVVEEPIEDGKLRGIGCCPGEVKGQVKVLRTPSDDMRLSGEILVAERTDPGWVPLYPSVSGVLIERGSILSHSAIVAREMGIPTIVGIQGLIATIKTGDKVSMNGATGVIEVVKESDTSKE